MDVPYSKFLVICIGITMIGYMCAAIIKAIPWGLM